MHWLFTLRITWVTWRARAHSSCSASQESVHRTAHHYPKKISKFRIWNMVSTGCLLPSRMRTWSVASLTLCDPMTVARQASLFMRLSRHEYWSWLACPHSGNLPNLGIQPSTTASPALQADSISTETPEKPI